MKKKRIKKVDVREFPFVVRYESADHIYVARCIDLKGCHSEGKTVQEAIENIYEAIEGWIETALKNKISIPEPSKFTEQKFLLRLDSFNASKLSLMASTQNKSINLLINEAIASL